MKLKKEIKEKIDSFVDLKYISKTKHPSEDLYIYNYTPKCQFGKFWTTETMMCRGLILNGEDEIIARPFPKFFNYGEDEAAHIKSVDVEVFEKMDGSLGILYWVNDRPCIATRGSFSSDQAIVATKMIQERVDLWGVIGDRTKTFLFEIIFPENRIVVDYGNEKRLVLLSVRDTNTEEEFNLDDFDYPDKVKKYNLLFNGFADLQKQNLENSEGYVVLNRNGERLKIKFDEYLRLHRLITGINSKKIWELLKSGGDISELLDRVPDEFYEWVKSTEKDIRTKHAEIIARAHTILTKRKYDKMDRAKAAKEILKKHKEISNVIFSMIDGKDPDQQVWKIVKPISEQPFKKEV